MAYAAQEGFLLTSKDTDFYQRSLVFGAPPKVVWLRIGNVSTTAIATLLRQRYVAVRRFYEDADATFLPLI
jgi:predicted nuclease of predicted toxin-antitoxin system